MQFVELVASLAVILCLLLVSEYLWRTKRLQVEVSRKIVHIGTGAVVATWPHYLSWTLVQLLALALLAVILVSYYFHIFQSIHAIKRLTIGEILYPIGIGLAALLEPAPWVFTVAVLQLTVADSVAALMGHRYGKTNKYMLISHGKSVIGSISFFAAAFIIFVISSFIVSENGLPHLYGWFFWSAVALTIVENVSWYGLDDVTVPIATIVILTILTT